MVTPKRRAFVLGGGVAGLGTALGLADRGLAVTLLESRRQCGGRAFSSLDAVLGERLDNGVHVQLGCYRAMRALLQRLGTGDAFRQDRRLAIGYRFVGGAVTGLSLARLPVPIAMPWAVMRLDLPLRARLAALTGMGKVLLGARADETLAAWLSRRGQDGLPTEVMWRPLCRAIMNVEPAEASATSFLRTLREAFLGSAAAAAFWLPMRPWSVILGDAAPVALRSSGAELRVGCRVERLDVGERRVTAIHAGGERFELGGDDVVVSAMPWFALNKLLPAGTPPPPWAGLRSSPIVTAYFRLDDANGLPDDGPVVALVGGEPFHFVLRRPGDGPAHFALLSGGDRSFDGMTVDAIAAAARTQLGRFYPGVGLDGPVRIRKEQLATFVDGPGDAARRPPPGRLGSIADNLWVCGDWTATGLPATLEGAARSAERLLAAFDRDRRGAAAAAAQPSV